MSYKVSKSVTQSKNIYKSFIEQKVLFESAVDKILVNLKSYLLKNLYIECYSNFVFD